jgi:hypothetical protein
VSESLTVTSQGIAASASSHHARRQKMAPTTRTRKRRNAHVIPPQESVANASGHGTDIVMLQDEKTNVKRDENFAVTTMVSAVTPRTSERRQNQQACFSLPSGADCYNNESGLASPVSKRPVRSTRTRSHGRAKEDSSNTNKNTTTMTRGTTSREKKPRGLGELAQAFTRMIYVSNAFKSVLVCIVDIQQAHNSFFFTTEFGQSTH